MTDRGHRPENKVVLDLKELPIRSSLEQYKK